MRKMDEQDKKVWDWFSKLNLIQIKKLTKTHFGNLSIKNLNGDLVTEMYKKAKQ